MIESLVTLSIGYYREIDNQGQTNDVTYNFMMHVMSYILYFLCFIFNIMLLLKIYAGNFG